ncbi:hypothetical protein DVH05_003005 [Phytophthora capsici]|nr:hypothetical protein DVH05_003005 [Phytophthora capsici]
MKDCSCTPTVKEYTCRVVDDVEHKTILYYARYACAGVSKGTTFSTIDDKYISSSKITLLAFRYLLTYKGGISRELFDLLYDCMLTTKGISGAVKNITRRRHKRYYEIASKAAVAVEYRKREDSCFSPPLLATIEQYMSNNACVDEESLRNLWLEQTEIYSRLLTAQIAQSKCARLIRMDHSQKFCGKLKVWGSEGQKEQLSSVRMLLLVQNEVGQIVGKGLTSSENHEESAAILRSVVPKLDIHADPPPVCVCDDANKTRSLVTSVFGDSVKTKQDLFHVIQRFTEKIADKPQRKSLAKDLSSALYDVSGNIRTPEEVATRFNTVLQGVDVSSVRVNASTWQNCISVNLEQIRNGDLYVEDNEYMDNGKRVRVVSTSQLEGLHSKLRKLLDRIVSIEVGMRILDIFLLKHNLKTGAMYRRNPEFTAYDVMTLYRTSVLIHGLLPESPQLEFIRKLLVAPVQPTSMLQRIRPGGSSATLNRPWEQLHGLLSVSTTATEASMLRKRAPAADIRQLLLSVHVNRKHITQQRFVEQLRLEPDYVTASEFTSNEFSLLEQIRGEQLALDERKYWWKYCLAATTVLYNASVRQLDNPNLKLRLHSFRSIEKYLSAIDAKMKSRQNPPATASILQVDEQKQIDDQTNSEDDEWLQKKLFNLLREKGTVKKRTQVFCNLYDLAACMCTKISRKSKSYLKRRWSALRTADNRLERLKIVVRVPSQARHLNHDLLNLDSPPSSSQVNPEVPPLSLAASSVCIDPVVRTEIVASTCEHLTRTSEEATGTNATIPTTAYSSSSVLPTLEFVSPPELEIIDDETREFLRHLADTLPRSKGKWAVILQEYTKRNPDTKLSADNLRCRLKEKRKPHARSLSPAEQGEAVMSQVPIDAGDVVSGSAATVIQPGAHQDTASQKKKRRAACQSCRNAKRKCGADGNNVDCEYRQQTGRAITSFFSSVG